MLAGTYLGMIGSRSFCGVLEPAAVEAAVGNLGVTGGERLTDALQRSGLAGRALVQCEAGR